MATAMALARIEPASARACEESESGGEGEGVREAFVGAEVDA